MHKTKKGGISDAGVRPRFNGVHAVERELHYFEEELQHDLVRLAALDGAVLHAPELVAKAITRLVFAMGATAMDLPPEKDPELVEQISTMIRMIIVGARTPAAFRRG